MPPVSLPVAAGIGAGGSILGGLIGAGGSKSAAKTQAAAAQQAAQLQYSMYNQTVARLQPWVNLGMPAASQLGGLLGLTGYSASGVGGMGTGSLVQPFNPTMGQLTQTPGYQFTLNQGEAAVRNAASATGTGGGVAPGGKLTLSGPEGQGLGQYAENLASTTYQQQFNNYWSQLGNIYNMISGASASGANAAALTGQAGQNAAIGIGNTLQAGAASTASGIIGAANALGGSLSGVGNTALTYAMLHAQQPGAGGGSAVAQGGTNLLGSPTVAQPAPTGSAGFPY